MPREKILEDMVKKQYAAKRNITRWAVGISVWATRTMKKQRKRMTIFTGIPIFINILSLAA